MTGRSRFRRDQGPAVSLFPFLAVLLCTMGMLIMLLVLIGRDTADRESASHGDPLFSEEAFGRLASEEPAGSLPADRPEEKAEETSPEEAALAEAALSEAAPAETEEALSPEDERLFEEFMRLYGEMSEEDLADQRESAEWFLSELETVRDRTREELTEQRAKLAETENQISKLIAEVAELNRQAAALTEEAAPEEEAGRIRDEIGAKTEEIAQLNEEVEQLRQKAAESEGKPAYAILPYKGKSGTFRRPIYVECDENGIRLMPERVQFLPEDFLVAKYPGNPFDAGLRAARQYYIEKGEGNDENEPYPLLILKPESAQKYYIAKSALASWGGEFGYEFVESDAEIEYPQPDPELRRRVEEQVGMARARLAGPIAALLNQLEAEGRDPQFAAGEEESGMPPQGELASRLGPYARLETPPGEGNPAAGFGGGPGSAGFSAQGEPGIPTPGSGGLLDGYAPARTEGNYAGLGEGAAGFAQEDLPDGGLLGETTEGAEGNGLPGPDAAAPQAGSAGLSGAGEEDSLFAAGEGASPQADAAEVGSGETPLAQGDLPYSSETAVSTPAAPPASSAGGETTLFAETAPGGESDPKTPSIDPRQTVGNTTYLAGTEGEKKPVPEGAETEPLSGSPSKKDAGQAKEPRVKAERDKRAINLAEEMKKPSQTSIERPINVVCTAGEVRFPAQAGMRDPKTFDFRSEEDSRKILAAVVACVRGWHAAGRNMYWSPWIRITVAPGGEETAARLTRLMESQRVRVEVAGKERGS